MSETRRGVAHGAAPEDGRSRRTRAAGDDRYQAAPADADDNPPPHPVAGPHASGPASVELAALQAALAAEHAAVYGYGVVGGKVDAERKGEARAALDTHRARRDDLSRAARDLGAAPRPAAAAYALPFEVPDAAAAGRLAADLEDRVAGAHADLVRAATGARRRSAADALRDAAVRGARWRGASVAFPGLAERAAGPGSSPGTAGAPEAPGTPEAPGERHARRP